MAETPGRSIESWTSTDPRHEPTVIGAEVGIVFESAHRAETGFEYVNTRVTRPSPEGLDAWKRSAAFLARLPGELSDHEPTLRRLELTWSGAPGSDPEAHISGIVGATSAEQAVRAGERYQAEVAAALSDLAPTRWQPLTGPRSVSPGSFSSEAVARLRIAPATESGPDAVIYPLHARTIERALERVAHPTTLTVELLIFPRRQLPPADLRHDLYVHPVGGVAVEDRPGRRAVGHVDPADRWHFAVKVEVRSEGPLPSDLLSAIAADIRGTGQHSIDTVLSGRASPVDAEWELVHQEHREQRATLWYQGSDWPASVPRLNLREAACLFALPTGDDTRLVIPEELLRVPEAVPDSGWLLGTAQNRGRSIAVAAVDRTRHVYVCGRTGCGKTTLLTNLVAQDLLDERRVVIVLDPHGAFGEQVAGLVPASRIDEVVYLDPVDDVAPIGFNPLVVDRREEQQIVDLWVAILKEIFEPNGYNLVFGPIAERVFRALTATVMSMPGTTFVDVMELLADPTLWRRYEPHIRSKAVLTYWQQWQQTSSKEDSEQLPYLASKFSPLVDNPVVRRLINQPRSTFSFDRILEDGGIMIVPLQRSSTGPVAASFITRMLLHYLMRAVMRRGPATSHTRPVSLYIDEVQAVAGPILENLLAESRKFDLSATLANQHSAQLPDSLVHAIAGNVGTIVSYGVGVHDAPVMARMLGGGAQLAETLVRLPNYRAVVGTSPNGEPQPPFLLESPFPTEGFTAERLAEVRHASRANHGGIIPSDEGSRDYDVGGAVQLELCDGE